MIHLAVLMTCHNRKEKTLQSLACLTKQTNEHNFQVHIFLVDDGSTDGTSDAVKRQFLEVNIIKGDGNLYWNRGMYLAWKTARQVKDITHYLWLNDDTMLLPDAIHELLECERLTKGNAIICGAVCSSVTGEFTYGGKTINGVIVTPNGAIQNCQILNGNCVLVNKKICDDIGILDPIYPHAIGDHDYGFKVTSGGYSIATTRNFIGNCENNARLPKWCYNTTPLIERLKALYSPLGYSHPKYFFIYERRYFGLFTAIKHYFSIHLRVLIPSLWK